MSRRRTKKFVIIDRDLYEAGLKAKLGGRNKTFLLAFLAQTNGFEKDFDKKSWKRYTNLTGISKSHLSDCKSVLIKEGYMYEKDNILYLQKDLSKWGKFPKPGTIIKVPETGNKSSRKREHKVPETGKHILISQLNTQLKKKVVSQPIRKKGEVPEGLKRFLDDIGNFPDLKK